MARTKGSKTPPGSDRTLLYVMAAMVIPSGGPPYTRCRTCRRQVFGPDVAWRPTTEAQQRRALDRVVLLMRERMARHVRDEHGGEK